MCTGIEIALLATSLGGAAAAGVQMLGSKSAPQSAAPPPVENPAMTAATSRSSNAVVRVGGDKATKTEDTSPDYTDFKEKRVFGKALGGLGRGGLGL